MAGEWLKLEACTPDKAEVLAITARMGWDDTDLTVGKLFRIWRWFDQQTTDGNAAGVTTALLDRIVGVSGFCSAMQSVGWLDVTDTGVSLPNFDRHNGNTAKNRALTAKRVATHKANAKANASANDEVNAATVTGALPREEKKREEKKREETSFSDKDVGAAGAARTTEPKAARLPDDWKLPRAWGEWAMAEFPHWTADDVRLEGEKFADHWRSKSGKDSRKADWLATWRNWCRSDIAQRAHPIPRLQRGVKPNQMTDEQRAEWERAESEKAKHLLFGDVPQADVIEAQILELTHEAK